jgi:hypothetical protein
MCLRNRKKGPQTKNMQIATFADSLFSAKNLRICDLRNLLAERPPLVNRLMNAVFINEVAYELRSKLQYTGCTMYITKYILLNVNICK